MRPNTRISIAIPPSARTGPYYVAAACCTLSNFPFWDDFPHGFNRRKLEDQPACYVAYRGPGVEIGVSSFAAGAAAGV